MSVLPVAGIADYCGFLGSPGDCSDMYRGVWTVFERIHRGGGFVGVDDVVALLLLCYISPSRRNGREARRHVLLEGAAGTAKSEITKAVAAAFCSASLTLRERPEVTAENSGSAPDDKFDVFRAKAKMAPIPRAYHRISGTPDLLPSAFVGYEGRGKSGTFDFAEGPLLEPTSVFHVDEINRIPSRTLSVLLEAMAEGQVTLTSLMVDAANRQRMCPWLFVVGTQNPGSFIGTNPLPEPLLDRFMVRIPMPYLGPENLTGLLFDQTGRADGMGENAEGAGVTKPVCWEGVRELTGQVSVGRDVCRGISGILLGSWPLAATTALPGLVEHLPVDKKLRTIVEEYLEYGLGVRAGQALRDLSSVVAWCRTRGAEGATVIPEDVFLVAPFVLGHRLRFRRGVCDSVDEQADFVRRFCEAAWRLGDRCDRGKSNS